MTGMTALVTGGGTGLGRQFAVTLARAGAKVIIAARRQAPLESTAEDIRSTGGTAYCVPLDVTDAASVEAAFDAVSSIARIDVLVNNAGVAAAESILDMSEATSDQILDINLKGAWLVARAAAKTMIANGTAGSIINVTSVLGSIVQKGTANYPAAKAALIQLTRGMALEWARYGIRVNAIAPGYFLTDLSGGYLESEQGKAMIKRMPLRRVGRPEEFDGPLLLLASDASSYMTGSVIAVDGGLSIPFA